MHFLNKFYQNTDGNAVITTFDVVDLYTGTSHTFGVVAVRYFSLKCEDVKPRFNIPFTLESIYFRIDLFFIKKEYFFHWQSILFTGSGYCNGQGVCTNLCKT